MVLALVAPCVVLVLGLYGSRLSPGSIHPNDWFGQKRFVKKVQTGCAERADSSSSTRFLCVMLFLFIACYNDFLFVDPSGVSEQAAVCDGVFTRAMAGLGLGNRGAETRAKGRGQFVVADLGKSRQVDLGEVGNWGE
eukprot:TRINITY_DN25416_c0_g2_i1.p2 TRINITY_DN25416_c0_g2~~TRINITY_DN25416_c0_g2_i1.p2  ORF type:complete len:137 (-),score=23.64 TRINITY_DN25416_c0_g2_i1:44-454(-)